MTIDFRLYLITDRNLVVRQSSLVNRHSLLIAAVRKALKGGVRAVQLREKDLDTRPLLKLAYRMRDLTKEYNAKLFINDRFDIALAAGADGVHLTQGSIPAEAVRNAVGRKLLIGVSTHSMKEAKEAEKGGADFITLGPVYRTPSKLRYGDPVGVEILKKVSGKTGVPVFAIGGIKSGRIREVREAGAFGAAMISEILTAGDIKRKTEELVQYCSERIRTVRNGRNIQR